MACYLIIIVNSQYSREKAINIDHQVFKINKVKKN